MAGTSRADLRAETTDLGGTLAERSAIAEEIVAASRPAPSQAGLGSSPT